MAQHAHRGRRSPTELLARPGAAPTGRAGDAEADTMGEIAKSSARIERVVAGLPEGTIVMIFPWAGCLCAARILAELGDVGERFPGQGRLAVAAGVCPVTHASGKGRGWCSAGPAT